MGEELTKPFDFSSPWCPLFGRLPDIQDSFPDSPEYECIAIIKKARELWQVPNFFCLESKYPQNALLTARTIFESYDSVDQHMLEKGKNIHFKQREAIDFIKAFHLGMYFEDELFDNVDFDGKHVDGKFDYLILAIFAICEAWWQLECILVEGLHGDPLVLKGIHLARLLVFDATEQYSECVYSDVELIFNHGARVKKAQKDGQAGRKITKAERHKGWQEEANKIWGKNLTKMAVAKIIANRLDHLDTEANQKPVSANWISRHIKKPAK